MQYHARLGIETLESRDAPALFGNTWADPQHLRLSFAPDGVSVEGTPSELHSVLERTLPALVWQGAILDAAQTWSEVANLNIGLTGDAGSAFGAEGAEQGDPRFGDIRVGGLPMSDDALAATVPPNPLIPGTLGGDVFINTAAAFSVESLRGVALHELGHALGLEPSDDPQSVMFNVFSNKLALAPSDVAAVQALYGTRPPDSHEGSGGNGTLHTTTRVREPGGYDGATPLVEFGDISTTGDVDVFELRNLSNYSGPITFRLQTYGVSLLDAQMGIRNEARQVIGSGTGSSGRGGIQTVTIPNTVPGGVYYVLIRATPGTANDTGRYSLGITFEGQRQPTPTPLPNVLRGPYDTLEKDEIEELFWNPTGTVFETDDPGAITELETASGFPEATRYRTTGSIGVPGEIDLYEVRAPQTLDDQVVLTATVQGVRPNGTVPRISVFDDQNAPAEATILANGSGTFSIQATGLPANERYLIQLGEISQLGNYSLDVSFVTPAAQPRVLASGSVDPTAAIGSTLYVARTQAFGLGVTTTAAPGVTVHFSIADANGEEVFALTGVAEDTVTGPTALLIPGRYTTRVTATGTATVTIAGEVISDPVGPRPVQSVSAPQYQDPVEPDTYLYPTGTQTLDPFLWLPWFLL